MIYWSQGGGSDIIFRSSIDNRSFEYIADGQSLALDTINDKLYWGKANGDIWRSNLDGSAAEFVINRGEDAQDIELYLIPEPATLLLFGFGCLALRRKGVAWA